MCSPASENSVVDRSTGHSGGRVVLGLAAEPEREVDDLGDRDEQAERRDELGQRGGRPEVSVQRPVQQQARAVGRRPPPAMSAAGTSGHSWFLRSHVEHGGRCVRLGRERQVEDAGGLVVEDEPDGEQRRTRTRWAGRWTAYSSRSLSTSASPCAGHPGRAWSRGRSCGCVTAGSSRRGSRCRIH